MCGRNNVQLKTILAGTRKEVAFDSRRLSYRVERNTQGRYHPGYTSIAPWDQLRIRVLQARVGFGSLSISPTALYSACSITFLSLNGNCTQILKCLTRAFLL